MSPEAELLVNVGPRESRVALLEHGSLQEVHIERQGQRGIVGNVYKGRVVRVLPGMQAAFIDVGLQRTAFLHAADIAPGRAGEEAAAPVPDIRRLVSQGDELLVQVVKDPMGTKGARLTTFVALPSRYLVYLPRGAGIGVSARIEDEAERQRLKAQLAAALPPAAAGGYIVRTAAQGAPPAGLAEDVLYLERLWRHVREGAAGLPAGSCVHEDLPLPLRVLRDELVPAVRRVLVDAPAAHAAMAAFAATFLPGGTVPIELYAGPRPLFDLHGVEDELERALERKVPLKSGGHLVIDQTESMTTIDVNTGAYVGHRSLEETTYRTNLEAAAAIARQLRLRNLGGIIIIDFIDMTDPAHRRQVVQALEQALAGDRAQTHIASLSPLGLVEMTRKRTRESLEHQLCAPCTACEGRGYVKTPETVAQAVLRDLLRQGRQGASRELLVLANPAVVEYLQDHDAGGIAGLAQQVGRPIRLQVEGQYGVEQFDVVPV